jgi:hypothetical protein
VRNGLTHRLALVISGAVALGAYEAGVLARLYRDLQAINALAIRARTPRLVIDAVAGSSAGAVTGLLLVQALTLDLPPEDFEGIMRRVWVEGLDILALLEPAEDPAEAIFTQTAIKKLMDAVSLAPPSGVSRAPGAASSLLGLWVTLTNLDGIPYSIPFDQEEAHDNPVTFYPLGHRDHDGFVVRGGEVREASLPVYRVKPDGWRDLALSSWPHMLAVAQASAAFPIAFRTQRLERDLTRYKGYREFKDELARTDPQLATRLAERATFRYVDGGVFNNRPLGRAIDAVGYLERLDPARAADMRTFLVIDPDPETPHSIIQLVQRPADAREPGPGVLLAHLARAYFSGALYTDIAEAARVNRRLKIIDEISSDGGLTDHQRDVVREAFGLQDKRVIILERVPHTLPLIDRLAGEFAGHFGGFFAQALRRADFETGEYEARRWLRTWLERRAKAWGREVGEALRDDPPPPDLVLANIGWHHLEGRRERILVKALDRSEVLVGRWLPSAAPYLEAMRTLLAPKVMQLFAGKPRAGLNWLGFARDLLGTPALGPILGVLVLLFVLSGVVWALIFLAVRALLLPT